ncbi:MAG: hypothetical protein HY897_06300 [Deltaproteobacteria bacterium]|nr:hypothetical protein [Deltaproteobacteria bacterium]
MKDEIQSLLATGDVEAIQAIASTAPKARAKEAKRALHILASKGVKIPEARPAGERVFRPAKVDFESDCYLSGFDRDGRQAAIVFRRNPAGGVLGTLLIIHEEAGVETAREMQLSRRGYRTWIDTLAEGEHDVPPVHVEPDQLKRVLAAARAQTEARGRALPEAAAALPAEWYRPAEPAPEPDFPPDASLVAESDGLYREPEVMTWFPPRDVLLRVERKVQEAETSLVLVDEAQKVRRIGEVLGEATEEFFDKDRRRSFARRLRGTAFIFEITGRAAAAAVARSTAAWLDDPALNVGGCAFARQYFRRLFVIRGEAAEGEAASVPDRTGRLVVSPAEFAAEMARKKA